MTWTKDLVLEKKSDVAIRRLYIHNFRCFDDFTLDLEDHQSVLLIGKNGSGKSTVMKVLEIFRSIASGKNKAKDLIKRDDYNRNKSFELDPNIVFEIDLRVGSFDFCYRVVFSFCYSDVWVVGEKLSRLPGGNIFYKFDNWLLLENGNQFIVDNGFLALPFIQTHNHELVNMVKSALSGMVLLSPVPALMGADNSDKSADLDSSGVRICQWYRDLLDSKGFFSEFYDDFIDILRRSVPKLHGVTLFCVGNKIEISIESEDKLRNFSWSSLSDGEKCLILHAIICAANQNQSHGPFICFWDNPENYIVFNEVSSFITQLRCSFLTHGQLIMATQNPATIKMFSNHNTIILQRQNSLERVFPFELNVADENTIDEDIVDVICRDGFPDSATPTA